MPPTSVLRAATDTPRHSHAAAVDTTLGAAAAAAHSTAWVLPLEVATAVLQEFLLYDVRFEVMDPAALFPRDLSRVPR